MSTQTFWITGAASGLGLSLTTRALSAGHRVLATDLDLDRLEHAAEANGWARDRVILHALDVRDANAWRTGVALVRERFPRLDVMINNAGVLVSGPCHLASDHDIELTLDVNVKGVMFGSRAAAELMLPQRGGHIVNICSLSSLTAVPGIGVYSASKFAVRGYTLALAAELAQHGITVTCVNPDGIATPLLTPHAHDEHAALIFTGPRLLSAREVSEAVLGRVLRDKPLEITLPESRGWMAKLASLNPESSARAFKVMKWYGQRKQQKAAL